MRKRCRNPLTLLSQHFRKCLVVSPFQRFCSLEKLLRSCLLSHVISVLFASQRLCWFSILSILMKKRFEQFYTAKRMRLQKNKFTNDCLMSISCLNGAYFIYRVKMLRLKIRCNAVTTAVKWCNRKHLVVFVCDFCFLILVGKKFNLPDPSDMSSFVFQPVGECCSNAAPKKDEMRCN